MHTAFHAVVRSPQRVFAALMALHFVVWTALPTLFYLNLPLDLIEAMTYGREWQLGHDKLPPLPWWMAEIAYRLTGHDIGFYALAQIVVVASLALVFAMARPLVGAPGALVTVLIVDGLHFFHYTAVKFNHDVVQLPLWALAGLAFHRALRTGSTVWWAALGLAAGVALWAKYFVVILLVPLALFMLIDGRARAQLLRPGPYLAAVVAVAVAAPHLVWLVQNDFLPFAYADRRAVAVAGVIGHLVQPLKFAVSQLAFLVPSLVIAAPMLRAPRPASDMPADDYDRRIVTVLAFGPVTVLLVLSLLTGRSLVEMWGYPLWLPLGLWLVLTVRPVLEARVLGRMLALWGAVFAVMAIAFIVNYGVLPRYDHRYRAVLYPGAALGEQLSARFRATTGAPLAYVVGTMWTAGNAAHYAPERPRVLIDGDPKRAPWIDLDDLRRRGAVVTWSDADPLPLRQALAAFPGAELQPSFTLPFRLGNGETTVHWAIVPPGTTSVLAGLPGG